MPTKMDYKVPLGSKELHAYILDVSYFSGKLEAYLKYKGIDFKRVELQHKDWATTIAEKTGLMQVPVIHDTVADVWLRDTTPIIELFEADEGLSKKATGILPDCPVQRFVSHLLEDFADEWMWRPALYYRWGFKTDKDLYGRRIYMDINRKIMLPEFVAKASIIRRQVNTYLYNDGIRDEATKANTEQLYLDVLNILQIHFEKHQYILGTQPTMADFGFFASMFRHFSLDPTPAKIMRQRGPAVYEWVARMWNVKNQGPGSPRVSAPDGDIPDTLYPLFDIISDQYLPYLNANAVAFKNNKTKFDFTVGDACYKFNVVPYRVWCREKLQDHFNDMPSDDQNAVRIFLEKRNCFKELFSDGIIRSNKDHNGADPPFCREKNYNLMEKVKMYFGGTPWHESQESLPNSFFMVCTVVCLILGLIFFGVGMLLSLTD
ncbi:unnamed protein product [Owenia fusiformis]|uniref:Uncharacterized protein n=1 Tax=Owenia fusiformis TaxID=6347 RepID=A0A8J1UB63_OWEFU|nr:unnamed protein product [Owenia fusiformis]